MKHKLLYFLPMLLLLGTGCFKARQAVPIPEPSGIFAGQFRIVHVTLSTNKKDTLRKANIALNLNGGTKVFSVTGDTATAHAGSFGTYTISSPLINFTDKTFSAAAPGDKTHLTGLYQYYFDGTILQIAAGNDTLSLQYDLKRQN